MSVREALRDAMAEEMRRDDRGLRHGRGGRRIPGRLQGHPGAARRIRRRPGGRHADHRAWLRRPRRRRRARGAQADRRVHDLQLRHAGDGPDRQFGRQDALHVRRPDGLSDRLPRPERRRGARRRPAQPGLFGLVQPGAGPQGRPAAHRRRRQGAAQGGDPRSRIRSSSSRTRSSTASPSRCRRWTTSSSRSARPRSRGPART